MSAIQPAAFRLTVLNPGGRDSEQAFDDGAGAQEQPHAPVNFHGYAACTGGNFRRSTARAIADESAVLLLLRGNFREAEFALQRLQKAGRTVAVSLKETGLHQLAEQLQDGPKLARFLRIVRGAHGCIGATPEAADFYRNAGAPRGAVAFIPTPYPIADRRWDFSQSINQRAGIFVGTREWNVPSRNHLAALLAGRQLSETTGERVTVYNFDRRKGARRLAQLKFPKDKLRVLDRRIGYVSYLHEIAQHKIVLQLDSSFVPGQVAGDAVLGRVPCVGGNGAIDRLAFPDSCSFGRSIAETTDIAFRLLTDRAHYEQVVGAIGSHAEYAIGFEAVARQLREFYATPIASK